MSQMASYTSIMNDVPALRPNVAVGEALRAVARTILAEAHTAIGDPARSQADAVHDLRRAMKRWRALLRLVEPFVAEARTLREEARALAAALSGARDGQAALDALADLEAHGLALSARSIEGLRRRLAQLRDAAEINLDDEMRRQIGAALDRAGQLVDRWPLHTLTFADVAEQLVRGYRRARQLVPERWREAAPEELHELRKRVVVHRHQMDLVLPLWPRFVKVWTGEAQRMRDRLGKHQDAGALARLTGPHQPLARWRSHLAGGIAAREAAHVAAAARIAAKLFVDKPGALRRRLDAMWETGR